MLSSPDEPEIFVIKSNMSGGKQFPEVIDTLNNAIWSKIYSCAAQRENREARNSQLNPCNKLILRLNSTNLQMHLTENHKIFRFKDFQAKLPKSFRCFVALKHRSLFSLSLMDCLRCNIAIS